MQAWFAGDFERCLELSDAVRLSDAETRTHVGVLKARALLRLDRPEDALRTLRDLAAIPCGTDESITIRMLTGVARVRGNALEEGLASLLETQADATRAHRTIRSELALNVALAHYARRDFSAAERALSQVTADADLVYARAVQYRAWIAMAREYNERASALFVEALEELDRCKHYDRFFEANCVRALAHLAVERLDRATWAVVASRRARIDWTSNGLGQPRFFIAYCAAAYQLDVEGNPLEAAREARHAEAIAPSAAFRSQALCKRASIARCLREPIAQRDHADAATVALAGAPWERLVGDEKTVPLILAEELAPIDTAEAAAMFALSRQLSPMSPTLLLAQASSHEAYRTSVEAAILESAGKHDAAVSAYRSAFSRFASKGYIRRAAIAALHLVRLTGDRKLLVLAERATRHLPPASWLRREVEALKSRRTKLTDVQHEVLMLICQGKSNPEIARLRKRSLHTVRNLVARLFEIFEVKSREELAVECVRRGIDKPRS
jgi:DNA-binding CsgD family transcriptional regulator